MEQKILGEAHETMNDYEAAGLTWIKDSFPYFFPLHQYSNLVLIGNHPETFDIYPSMWMS